MENIPQSFSVTNDKIRLISDAKFVEWCPTMDLIAIVTVDNNVSVHRFISWQRLFNITSDDSKVNFTSIAWRPDGKTLALGTQEGSLHLYNVENGQVIYSAKIHNGNEIHRLQWVQEIHSSTESHFKWFKERAYELLPPLQTLSENDTSSSNFKRETYFAEQTTSPHQLDILVSADITGGITFYAFGTYCIGSVHLNDLQNRKDVNLENPLLLNVFLSPDLRVFFIVVRTGMEGDFSVSILHFDTSILWQRKNELREISIQYSCIKQELKLLEESTLKMQQNWSETFAQFTSQLNSLQQHIRGKQIHFLFAKEEDENVQSTIPQQFTTLLLIGNASNPMKQFLLNTLSESGLRKLRKQFESCCTELQNIILNQLQRISEVLLTRLSELKHEQFGVIGLQESQMNELMESSSRFFSKLEELLKTVGKIKEEYDMFFRWLLKAQNRLSETESVNPTSFGKISEVSVANFIKKYLMNDVIGQYLPSSSKDEIPTRIEKPKSALSSFLPFSETNESLIQSLSNLSKLTEKTFSQPSSTIGASLSFKSSVSLCGLDGDQTSLKTLFYPMKDSHNTVYVAFQPKLDLLPIEAIWLLELNTSNLQIWKATLLQGNQTHQIVDFSFYSDDTIAILSKNIPEGNQELGISFYKYCESEDGLPYSQLPISSIKHSRAVDSLLSSLQFAQMVSQERSPYKSRIQANIEPTMLAISPARKRGGGVAAIVANGRRLVLFDLEADEEETEEIQETENMEE